MLFQVLCGFEPIFYTTHPNEEPEMAGGTGGYTCRWKTSIKGRLLYNLLLWRNNRIYGFGTGSVLTN